MARFPYPVRCFALSAMLLLILSPIVSAADRIALCRAGGTDDALWGSIKKHFTAKGYVLTTCDSPKTIEKQIESANKINKEKVRCMIVVELIPSDTPDVFVAISNAKKGKGGLIYSADEIPANHGERSEELASAIAQRFQKKLRRLPLFMLLGIDAPGVFVKLNIPREKSQDFFDKLSDGLSTLRERGSKDEREFKGERRNPKPED